MRAREKPKGPTMNNLPKWQRVIIRLLISGLALLTGYVSWGHGHHTAGYLGETALAAVLLPFVPDVAMMVSIFIRLVMPDNRWAKIGMISGIAFTIWLNIMNVKIFPGELGRTVGSVVLSLMSPFFLFVCIEMLFSIDSIKAKVQAKKEAEEQAEKERLDAIVHAAEVARREEEALRQVEIARLAQEQADRLLAEKLEAERREAEAKAAEDALTPQQKGWLTRQRKAQEEAATKAS